MVTVILASATMPVAGDGPPVTDAYRTWLFAAIGKYLDTSRAEAAASWAEDATSAEMRARRLDEIRWQREALLPTAEDMALQAEALERAGEER